MGQVGNMKGDMVQPFAPFFQEFGNHGIRSSCLEQLDAALTHRNHGHFDLLVLDHFFAHNVQAQLFVQFSRLGQ